MGSTRLTCRVAAFIAIALVALGGLSAPANAKDSGPQPQIIGGGPAATGEFPFMAAILNESLPGSDYDRQFCGGSLIGTDWVLTAAHCVEGTAPDTLAVAVGRTVLSSNQGQRRDVVAVYVHPSFGQPTSLAHDAALLRLASPVAGIAPIRLAGSADDALEAAGRVLTVIGWGNVKTHGQPDYPDALRKVDVPVVGDASRARTYGASLHQPTMVCAGAAGIDSCQGDSGGPLFATTSGQRTQVGIVSWGNGCAKKRFPGVYSEVNNASIRSWIAATSGI